MTAIWIMAGSMLLLAVCACAYVWLRISDEIRFRHMLNDLDRTPESGQIVIPKRQRGGSGGRGGDYRRRKAQEWIDMRVGKRGGGEKA